MKAKTKEQFIKESVEKHGDKYDYNKATYVTAKTKTTITCKIHGDFLQTPGDHIRGCGCPKCGKLRAHSSNRASLEEFVEKAKKVHQDTYTYKDAEYVNCKTPITITCEHHGNFKQIPTHHTNGHGCPRCASKGTNYDKSATLYYVKLVGTDLYKLGITNKSTVLDRFEMADKEKIEILFTKHFQLGLDAFYNEQLLLLQFSGLRYRGERLLYNGNSELLTEDILHILKDRKWRVTSPLELNKQ